MSELSTLYQTDYPEWARRTAQLLRAGDYTALDIERLLEELGDMGKSEQRELPDRCRMRSTIPVSRRPR